MVYGRFKKLAQERETSQHSGKKLRKLRYARMHKKLVPTLAMHVYGKSFV